MSKCMQTKKLSPDKIATIIEELSLLMPSNRLSTREVLESQQAVILAAIERGNSLRDIVNFLTKKGLKSSHETLRKCVLRWQGVASSSVKTESKKKQDLQKMGEVVAVKKNATSLQSVDHSVSNFEMGKPGGAEQSAVKEDSSGMPKESQGQAVDDGSNASNLQASLSQIQGSKCANGDALALSKDSQNGVPEKMRQVSILGKNNNVDKIIKATFDVEPDKEKY